MKRCDRQRSARNLGKQDMANNLKLRVSPFGLIATPTQNDARDASASAHDDAARRHRSRRYVPCSRERRRIRTAALPPTSWLAICIAIEESELDEAGDPISIH